MKKLLIVFALLAFMATNLQAQPLEVRARHYRHVVDDMRPGVHKTYDPRRDCMVWRDGRGRFLGEVRNTITLREKRILDRRRGVHPGPPPPPRAAYGPTPGERRAMRREAERREVRREMRREAARREMRREMRRDEMRREMRRDAAVRDMRRDAARREAVRREARRDQMRREQVRREVRRDARNNEMRRDAARRRGY